MLKPPRSNVRFGQWLQPALEPERIVCSESLYNMLGYARGAMELGDAVFGRIVHPDDRFRLAVFRDAIARAQFGEYSLDCRLRRADGAWIGVRLSSLVLPDSGSSVIAGTVELLDGGAAQPIIGVLETVRYASDLMRSPVMIFAPDGALVYANAAANALDGTGTAPGPHSTATADRGFARIVHDAIAAALADAAPDGLCEVTFGGRAWLCHAIALSSPTDPPANIAVFCHDVTKIHESADQRVAAEQELTRTLVKEVHHRIKNNLQATVGLLRQHTLGHEDSNVVLSKGISQLLSIAAVHGIQARVHEDRIYLCSVVAEVARAARTISASSLRIDAPEPLRMFAIDEHYAVQIALVVNELVTNATKYTIRDANSRVSVSIDRDAASGARLIVTNRPARLPEGFDLASGEGLGAGLRLVKSLLPRGLAALSIEARDASVSATLQIDTPVVTRCEGPARNHVDQNSSH